MAFISVADPDPGSGAFLTPGPGSEIQDPVPFLPLDPDPGSGIGFFPDLGSRSQTHIFESLVTNFWVKVI